MRPLIICCAIIAQCLAQGVGRHGTHPRMSQERGSRKYGSIDQSNDNDWTIPDAQFIYNFEQMKNNEPTQIDHREENLGKYAPTTTTIIPKSVIEDSSSDEDDQSVEIKGTFTSPVIVLEKPHRHNRRKHHHHSKKSNSSSVPEKQEVWNYQTAFPEKMPTPPTLPKWQEIAELLKHHPHHHSAKPHHISTHKLSATPVTSESPAKMTEHTNSNTHSHRHVAKRPQHVHRGSHKFNWNEEFSRLSTSAPSTTVKSLPPVIANSPPPVPTLSPWYDNFGK